MSAHDIIFYYIYLYRFISPQKIQAPFRHKSAEQNAILFFIISRTAQIYNVQILKYAPPLVQSGETAGREVVRNAHALDVDIPDRLVYIRVERAVERVEGMGADIVSAAGYGRDEQRVVKMPRRAAELDKIAGQQAARVRLHGKGARSGVVHDEIVQVRHARPRGRAAVRRRIVPAVRRRKVHLATAGIDALGHEICAVAPDAGKIIEQRIAAVRPLFCVCNRVFPVVIHDFQSDHPAFSLCRAEPGRAPTPAPAYIPCHLPAGR